MDESLETNAREQFVNPNETVHKKYGLSTMHYECGKYFETK
jgi:hypothetical protein